MIYAGSFLVTSSVFVVLQSQLLLHRTHLLRGPLTASSRRAVLRRAAVAPPAHLVAGLLGMLSPYLTLAVCAVMGAFYLLPPRRARTGSELRGMTGASQ